MKLKYFVEILKFSIKPLTIIYPIPLLQLVVLSHSNHDLRSLLLALAFSFTFYPAVNIWNHVNDVREDILGGKYNVFAEGRDVMLLGVLLTIVLYSTSLLIVIKYGTTLSLILFTICFLITWFYSDRFFIKKRLKDYYTTELLSFLIFYPSFTLLLWTFFDELSIRAFALSLTILFFVLFGVFLKDVRDISGDSLAGLKTLGVVFSPKTLLKLAYTSIILYYVSILTFTSLGIFSSLNFIMILPFALTIKYALSFAKNDWIISKNVIYFKKTLILNMTSLVIFTIIGLLSQS